MALEEAVEGLVRDEGHLAGRERAQAVVHGLEVEALEVRDLALDVERHDLALAVLGHLVAAGVALEDQAALGGFVALAHDVLVGPDLPHVHRQVEEGILLRLARGR